LKVGIFGGTFDPIHSGHLIIANWVRDELGLDKIIFMPAAIPPHKKQMPISDPEVRWEMVRLAIEDNPYFEASRIELDRPGPSYTVMTIEQLKSAWHLSFHEIFLLIGADSLVMMPQWRNPERIFALCQVVVFPRPQIAINQAQLSFREQAIFVNTPLIQISASAIRERVKKGDSIRYLVPDPVHDFIFRQRLYQK